MTIRPMFRFLAGLIVFSLALAGCGSTEAGPASTATPPPTSVGRSYDYNELLALRHCPTSPIVVGGQTGITGYCGVVDAPLEKGQATSRIFAIGVVYPGASEAEVNQVKAIFEKTSFTVVVGDKGQPQTVPVLEVLLETNPCPNDCTEYALGISGAFPYNDYLLTHNVQVSWKYAPGKAYDFVPGPPGGK